MSRPVLLIAGGSRGIGASTAGSRRARLRCRGQLQDQRQSRGERVDAVKAAGGKAVAIQGDMGGEDDIERVFEAGRENARAGHPFRA